MHFGVTDKQLLDAIIRTFIITHIHRINKVPTPLLTFEEINNSASGNFFMIKGGGFWCIRKCHHFPKTRGLGVNFNILSTNPYQAAPRFQGIDKMKRIAHEGGQLKLTIRLTLKDSHFV